MATITTHYSPDLDAALGTWLAARYLVPRDGSVVYRFVPAGQTDVNADYVIDTGGEYNPACGRFDHHHPALASDITISAASLVYQHALDIAPTDALREELRALWPLVEVVVAGDHGKAGAWSYMLGLHALAGELRARYAGDDYRILGELHILIDLIAARLVKIALLERDANIHALAVGDGVVLVRGGSTGLTRYLLETSRAQVVLFVNDFRDKAPPSVVVGIQRGDETGLHCGELVAAMRAMAEDESQNDVSAELARWYCHPSGFFSGRGTMKNPDPTPLEEETLQWIVSSLCRAVRVARAQ